MRRAGPVSGSWAGSNTGMKLFVAFIWKVVLVSELKMKSSCKTVFYGLEKNLT